MLTFFISDHSKMFGGRSSDSSSSSSYKPDTGGPYLCEHCQDNKIINGMFNLLIECPHCSENSPIAGSSFFRRSDDEDSSLEESFGEGYRLGDFTRGFIRGMTQVQNESSDSEDEDYDWRRETYSKVHREPFLRTAIPPRREEVPNTKPGTNTKKVPNQKTNVIEEASAEESLRLEQPQTEDLQQENLETEVNPKEKQENVREDETICKYCQQRFDASDQPISLTICGHNLHTHCMDMHLPGSKQCPICKCHIDWTDVTKECVFCLENFRGWEKVHVLACGHDCHLECSGQLLTPQPKCPKCEKTYYWTGIQCSICLENMSLAEETRKLLCQHEFHVECLRSWLQDHTTCPLCRTMVTDRRGR